jgi:hypothetical protein
MYGQRLGCRETQNLVVCHVGNSFRATKMGGGFENFLHERLRDGEGKIIQNTAWNMDEDKYNTSLYGPAKKLCLGSRVCIE